jgi:hypothetical protein
MKVSGWVTLTLDYDRDTEFVGDDADRYSELCDLGGLYEKVLVFIPALDAASTVTPYIQRDNNVATVPVAVHALDDDATGSFAHATSSGSGDIAVVFNISGAETFRLYTSANQAANRVFYCRGFNV